MFFYRLVEADLLARKPPGLERKTAQNERSLILWKKILTFHLGIQMPWALSEHTSEQIIAESSNREHPERRDEYF